ncbi:hypothetical protein CNYM01_08366 [Colletotrichum nymphaeae SA-01]|uniref:Zn(2)-C6 fungal-type domain-containing protein n=1 Tax=Colletotrichum nymphaeae SA-01 TaxID=1460502 RepID=A0A135SP39_9PEZI|nr:hypothetical protein CNYM01_08366 [Colletotrichum nymphaeae SA-01]
MNARSGACHTCRRSRLKCDRSVPHCLKCTSRDQNCLRYGVLLRWGNGVASRGKLATVASDKIKQISERDTISTLQASWGSIESTRQLPSASSEPKSPHSLPRSLLDPLAEGLDYRSRRYLAYFASNVCKDLVLYDIPNRNPFRQLIAVAYQQPILMQTIVANSALHMSNTYQRLPQSSIMSAMIASTQSSTSLSNSLLAERCGPDLPEIIHDALMAKQQALVMLQSALEDMTTVNVDLILAVVLLLISCELIDSGQGNWMFHINGARVITEKLIASAMATETAWSPLCRSLISNCLV